MKSNASKPKNIKENNMSAVLELLYENHELTAQVLSEQTGISKTTVNKLLNDLTAAGVILTERKGESTSEGGRKPDVYRFNESYKYVVSTEIYENSIYVCILDLNCTILYNYVDENEEILQFPERMAALRSQIILALQKMNILTELVCAVVVNCSAIVDESRGVIENTTIGSWDGEQPVAEALSGLFPENTRIIINNISRFSGYAELFKCPELKKQRFATLLFWDDTVGGAMIRRGRYENGDNHLIGEIGHLVVAPIGGIEHMGNPSGQFENLTNQSSLLQYALTNGRQHRDSVLYDCIRSKTLTLDNIFAAYRSGDAFAEEILQRSAYYIALVMHSIALIYDPKVFILQGFYVQAGDKFLRTLYEMMHRLIPFSREDSFKIVYSAYGEEYKNAFNIGSALYAVERLIEKNFYIV